MGVFATKYNHLFMTVLHTQNHIVLHRQCFMHNLRICMLKMSNGTHSQVREHRIAAHEHLSGNKSPELSVSYFSIDMHKVVLLGTWMQIKGRCECRIMAAFHTYPIVGKVAYSWWSYIPPEGTGGKEYSTYPSFRCSRTRIVEID